MITTFLGYQLPDLKADFEFENFFPSADADIQFYENHLKKFGYDNDYLLIALENTEGVFNESFLKKVNSFASKLDTLSSIKQVLNPVKLQYFTHSPFGIIPLPAIHISSPERYEKDSTRIYGHPVYNRFFSKNGRALLVQLQHSHLNDQEQISEVISSIQQSLADYHFDKSGIVGKLAAQNEFISLIQKDFSVFLLIALSASFLMLALVFRSFKAALMPYLISLTTLVWLMGLMAMLNIPITILGSLIPPVMLFVSSSDTIHLTNAFRNSPSGHFKSKLKLTVKKVFMPTLLTSVTTAAGFFSLVTIDTVPIRQFGIFVGIGVLMAFIITFLFGPLLLGFAKNMVAPSFRVKSPVIWLFRNQKLIIALNIGLVIIAIYGISLVRTDTYLLNDLPPQSTVRNDFTYVDEQFSGSKPWEMAYWPTDTSGSIWDPKVMNEARKIHEYLTSKYPMDQVWSPVSLIKYGNQIYQGPFHNSFVYPSAQNYAKAHRSIDKILKVRELPLLVDSTSRYARFSGFIPELGSIETNRRNILLINHLNKSIDSNILRFQLTGTTYLIDKSHKLLSYNLLKGLAIAVIIVSLILALYFKSFKILIVSMIPNLIPLIISGGIMGIAGISLNLTTSIIFVVSFGIAVDDTIHLISVYQNHKSKGKNRLFWIVKTFKSAGHSVIITSLIIVSGFAIFMLSSFGATFFLGLFLSFSLITALVVDLTLLPLLLHHSTKSINHNPVIKL